MFIFWSVFIFFGTYRLFASSGELFDNLILLFEAAQLWSTFEITDYRRFQNSKSSLKFFCKFFIITKKYFIFCHQKSYKIGDFVHVTSCSLWAGRFFPLPARLLRSVNWCCVLAQSIPHSIYYSAVQVYTSYRRRSQSNYFFLQKLRNLAVKNSPKICSFFEVSLSFLALTVFLLVRGKCLIIQLCSLMQHNSNPHLKSGTTDDFKTPKALQSSSQ